MDRQADDAVADPAELALLQSACEEAARLLRCDGAMTYLLDDASGELRFATGAGIVDRRANRIIRELRLPPGVGMFGRALAEGRVVSTGDYLQDPQFVHAPGADTVVTDVGMRSMVSAPLAAGETVLGAMGVYADMLDAFGPADIALVKSLAEHAATAIVNRRLIADLALSQEALKRRAEAERALREIAGRISAIREPAELLQQVVDEAARLLRADGARIDLLDPRDGVLYWAFDAATGRRPGIGPIEGDGEAQAGEGISGRAVTERRAVYTGDYLVDDRFVHASMPDAHADRYGLRSVLAAPLLGDADPFGTLTVYSSTPDAYGTEDASLIEALANQAGVAIRNARLFEELARSREESARRADAERTLREIGARITAVRDARENHPPDRRGGRPPPRSRAGLHQPHRPREQCRWLDLVLTDGGRARRVDGRRSGPRRRRRHRQGHRRPPAVHDRRLPQRRPVHPSTRPRPLHRRDGHDLVAGGADVRRR